MGKQNRFSREVRERSVRMVLEHEEEHAARWAVIRSVAEKMGCSAETLRKWVARAEVDHGRRAGLPSEERERLTD